MLFLKDGGNKHTNLSIYEFILLIAENVAG